MSLLNENNEKTLNILLLSPMGAGKSTFINAMANYFIYPSLDVAAEKGSIDLIPSKFKLVDEDDNIFNISSKGINANLAANELMNDESSSNTKNPRSYLFKLAHTNIRLIDTPGKVMFVKVT